MKILITGGAGFIGSHVVKLFCEKKHIVTVLDDLSFGHRSFLDKRARYIEGSFEDRKILDIILPKIDIIIHLAASSIISFSYNNPIKYFKNNFMNGILMLEAMRTHGVKKIIYSSTSSVYGQPSRIPVKESDTLNPMTIYGASKLAFENALIGYYHSFGIESISFRYFNVYGPQDEQKPATRAVPMWIDDILSNRQVSWYWDGKQTRDFIYVEDVAKAHEAVIKLRGCNVFNIASGKGVEMRELIHIFENILNRKIKTKNKGERKGDPMNVVADIAKIKLSTTWRPSVSLDKGLKETFEYYKNKR